MNVLEFSRITLVKGRQVIIYQCITKCNHSAQCGKIENLLSQKKISLNRLRLFSDFFSLTVTFTGFLPKKRESEFPYIIFTNIYPKKIFREIVLQYGVSEKVVFAEVFITEKRESEIP